MVGSRPKDCCESWNIHLPVPSSLPQQHLRGGSKGRRLLEQEGRRSQAGERRKDRVLDRTVVEDIAASRGRTGG